MAWSNDWVNLFWGVKVISKDWFEVNFDLKKILGGWDRNVKFRNRPEEVFEFLRYLMVIRFLNDLNGLILDLILSKFEV